MGAAAAGVSTCSQCCQRGVTESCSAFDSFRGPQQPQPPGVLTSGELMGLSYLPPPEPDGVKAVKALLGTQLPTKPLATQEWAPPPTRPSPTLCSSTSSRQGNGRPKDPVNKVYAQFSNDLEGFLPYTLVISEEQGLEFTSLSSSPDFNLNPLNVIRTIRVSYDELMQ